MKYWNCIAENNKPHLDKKEKTLVTMGLSLDKF